MRLRLKRAARSALVAALLVAAAPLAAQDQPSATLSLPQARSAARAALMQQDYGLAIQLARGLLQADPKDAQAYYIIALAYQKLGNANLSRRASGYAFRYATEDQDRYVTSQLAARMALQDKRYTLAQYWLRRSYDYVPDDRLRQQAEADFRRLRAENPWTVQLRFSLDPSDNINAGAEDRINEIDGSPLVGLLSPSSLALSGLTVNGQLDAAYRLHRGEDSETHLQLRASARRVILSDAARALLATTPPPPGSTTPPPLPDDGDFSSGFASLGISHAFRLGVRPGREKGNGYGRLSLTYGQSWYGGQRYFQNWKAGAERAFTLSGGRNLALGMTLEHRDYARTASQTGALQFSYATPVASAGKLTLGLSLAQTRSPNTAPNLRSTYGGAFVSFEPAKMIGPARLRLVLGASQSQYSDYRVGFFAVPGGRTDNTLQAAATFTFEDMGFAGFSPEMTLRNRVTRSNVGRFDTSEMTLSIGLSSNF